MKRKNETSNRLVIFLLILLITTFDQISKILINLLGFKIVCNRGIAFGLGGDMTLVSLVVLVIVFWLLFWTKEKYSKISLALIFAGGASNFIDRIFVGCVRDFMKIGLFPAFNLADVAIAIGTLLLLLTLFKDKRWI